MDQRVHLGELEEILPVIAACRMVECSTVGGEPVVGFAMGAFRGQIRVDASWRSSGQDDDRSVQTHLHLQVALRAAVVGARARRAGREAVAHRAARSSISEWSGQQAGYSAGGGYLEAGEQD